MLIINNLNFISSGTINFNDIISEDPDSIYEMFFADSVNNKFITINDSNNNPIKGKVLGRSSIPFTYNYTGEDVAIKIAVIGLRTAKYTATTGVLTKDNNITFQLISVRDYCYI